MELCRRIGLIFDFFSILHVHIHFDFASYIIGFRFNYI